MTRFNFRPISKYGAKKQEYNGMMFDSKKELNRYLELEMLEKAGKIYNLERQVKFVLIPSQREPDTVGKRGGTIKGKVIEKECRYIADFVYWEDGHVVVEDAKGFRTETYKIKKKLMLWVHGIQIKEI